MPKVCPNCELTYSDDDFFCAADGSPLRSTSAEPDNLVGTVIADRYRVEAILGEGGMGRVYRARHVRVPREAAIKVLRRALLADSYAIAAFNREARNAASVGDHPNVAAVYDFGETADGLVFLAMEFIEGETLTKRLEREPVLPPALDRVHAAPHVSPAKGRSRTTGRTMPRSRSSSTTASMPESSRRATRAGESLR